MSTALYNRLHTLIFSLFFSLIFLLSNFCQAQILNGPWIDTLYQQKFTSAVWPTNLLRFKLDVANDQPSNIFGQNGWASLIAPTDTNKYSVSVPFQYNPPYVRHKKWLVLPEFDLQDISRSYDFVWRSQGENNVNNMSIKIFACTSNCTNISLANLESSFIDQIYFLPQEIGQPFPGPYFYQHRKISLNALKGQKVRLAFFVGDSLKNPVRYREFLLRSSALHDLALNAIIPPELPCKLKAQEKVKVAIRNQGGAAATGFSVSLFSNGNLVETKLYGNTLAFDKSDTVLFSTVNMASPGLYNFKANITYLNDTLRFNDTLSKAYVHKAPTVLSSGGWRDNFTNTDTNMYRILDLDRDGYKFMFSKYAPSNIFGIEQRRDELWCLSKLTSSGGVPSNLDMLIGGCVAIQKDSVYDLSINWKIAAFSQGRNFKVLIGRQPTFDSVKTLIGSFSTEATNFRKAKIRFVAPKTDVYFFGLKYDWGPMFSQVIIKELSITKQRNLDLALFNIYRPSDTAYSCPGAMQNFQFRVDNQGTKIFINPSFELEVKGPNGTQTYFHTHQDLLHPGSRTLITFDSTLDLSSPGAYSFRLIHISPADQENINDTITGKWSSYAPKPKTYIETWSEGFFYNAPPGWWFKPGVLYIFGGELGRTFTGSGDIKLEGTAISPQFTGLGTSSNFVIDMNVQCPGPGNALGNGDTLDFLVALNCGPFISMRRLLPGLQRPVGNHKVYVDLSSLNIQPTDKVSLMLKATHLAEFVGADLTVKYKSIRIEQVAAIDASVSLPVLYPYSLTTPKHRPSFVPAFRSSNSGGQSLNPGLSRCTINPGAYIQLINGVSLQAGVGQNMSFPAFTPSAQKDTFRLQYSVQTAASQTDGIPENNLFTSSFIIGDSTMAKDYGPSEKRQGFTTTGSRSMMGQVFTLLANDTLSSISFYIDSLSALTRVKPVLYVCNPITGAPNSFVLDSSFNTYAVAVTQHKKWHRISLKRTSQNKGVPLNAGKYFIGLMQKQGFMALGYSKQTAEKRTVYQRLSAASGNAWTLVDTVGQLLLRANLWQKVTVGNQTQISATKPALKLYPNPAEDVLWIENEGNKGKETLYIYNSLGHKMVSKVVNSGKISLNVSAFPKGIYRVLLGDKFGSFVK